MENTRNTIPAEPRSWSLLIAGTCALALLVISAPHAIAALYALRGDPTLERMHAARPVATEALWKLAETRYEAAAWSTNPRYRMELGSALLRLAVAKGSTRLDREKLDLAISEFRAGLAAAPVDRDGWAQLALAQQLRNGPSKQVAAYLKMSILAGSADRRLSTLRLELGSRNWRYVAPGDRELILSQARLAWRASPRRVLEVTQTRLPLSIVRAALAKDAKSLQRFEVARARLKRTRGNRSMD